MKGTNLDGHRNVQWLFKILQHNVFKVIRAAAKTAQETVKRLHTVLTT